MTHQSQAPRPGDRDQPFLPFTDLIENRSTGTYVMPSYAPTASDLVAWMVCLDEGGDCVRTGPFETEEEASGYVDALELALDGADGGDPDRDIYTEILHVDTARFYAAVVNETENAARDRSNRMSPRAEHGDR